MTRIPVAEYFKKYTRGYLLYLGEGGLVKIKVYRYIITTMGFPILFRQILTSSISDIINQLEENRAMKYRPKNMEIDDLLQ